MTKQEIIDFCLTFAGAYEDYPFDPTSTVMRHSGNKKMFALVDHLWGELQVTVKCDPMQAEILRGAFEGVIPGYHFNKKHWNTVYVEKDVPPDEVWEMIRHSYELIRPKRPRKQ
ncbi:MAG: MmcQ/YjbR family DNA-binding protein [Defluviitaleaceae bacterium]|nr:MmcQ/YjbR family DNA-binding protein [Defluviitaleaceae bacterium]